MINVNIETILYRIPPSFPWGDFTHAVSAIEIIETRIRTDKGLEGTGLSYTVGLGGTSINALIDDYVAAMLIGKDPIHIERIWTDVSGQLHRCGDGISSLALAAIDIALWDLLRKFYNQPLYKLLGGARERIRTYASGIDFSFDIKDLLEFV